MDDSVSSLSLDWDEAPDSHVYVDRFFEGVREKLRQVKDSSAKMPKDTRASVDRAYTLLCRGIRRIKRDLQPKFEQLKELDSLRKTKEELNILESERCALVSKFGELHATPGENAVTFTFPQRGAEACEAVTCNRDLVRRWSPAMAALLRHGNGLEETSPAVITLSGSTDAETMRAAIVFDTSGRFPDGTVQPLDGGEGEVKDQGTPAGPTGQEATREGVTVQKEGPAAEVLAKKKETNDEPEKELHPLLRFADLYELQEVRKYYFRMLKQKTELSIDSAAQYLELALRYNSHEVRDEAAALIARELKSYLWTFNTRARKTFLELPATAAAAVLAQDDLDCAQEEWLLIKYIRAWLEHKPGRVEHVGELLRSVRWKFVPFKALLSMKESVEADQVFASVRAELSTAIVNAFKDKLKAEDGEAGCRKRKCTNFDASEDESYAKMARFMANLQKSAGGA